MPDFFETFRWLAFVFVTIYVTITTAQSLWAWYIFLAQRDRYMDLLRSYVIVHGLRLRMRSFGGDSLMCVLLCVAFLLMWRAHVQLDAVNVAVTRAAASKTVHTLHYNERGATKIAVEDFPNGVAGQVRLTSEAERAGHASVPQGNGLSLGVFSSLIPHPSSLS